MAKRKIKRTPKEIKDDILEYLYEYNQWYMENILRDHVTEILAYGELEANMDICEITDGSGKTIPLDWFVEILYEKIMTNIDNVIACTEEEKEINI